MTHQFTSPQPEINQPPITVRGPAALAAALPYLLRIPLTGRLVITKVESGRFAQGASYATLPEYPPGSSTELRAQWAADVAALTADGVLATAPSDGYLAVVLYLPEGVPLDDSHTLRRIAAAFPPSALARILDLIAVADGQWRSLLCRNDDCCPSLGKPILDDVDAIRVAAELIDAGMAGERGPDSAAVARVGSALEHVAWPDTVAARAELLNKVWPIVAGLWPDLGPESVAQLVMAADRPGVRDAVLARLAKEHGRNDLRWALQEALWEGVTARTPSDWLPGPACMLAIARWAQSNLDGAARAVRQALDADPDHRMASLIDCLLRREVDAQDWIGRLSMLPEDDCLRFDRPRVRWREEQRPAV